jgi:hypothetical protein
MIKCREIYVGMLTLALNFFGSRVNGSPAEI